MRQLLRTTAVFVTSCLLGSPALYGQNVTVQQPALRNFSVRTTVTVPDRGRAHLGSVSRAGEFRSTVGPLRSGTSTATVREHASATSSVWIHDLQEIDRQVLGLAANQAERPARRSSPMHHAPGTGSHVSHVVGDAPFGGSAHALQQLGSTHHRGWRYRVDAARGPRVRVNPVTRPLLRVRPQP